MPESRSSNPAEASDRLATLTAAAAGVAAMIYLANVAELFASGLLADLVGYGQIGLGLIVLVVYLPALLLFKSRGGHAEGIRSAGGFMNAIMRKAASTAFNLTIGFVVALSILDRTVLSHFTAKSAIDLVIAFALAAFSVSFFILNQFTSGLGDEG